MGLKEVPQPPRTHCNAGACGVPLIRRVLWAAPGVLGPQHPALSRGWTRRTQSCLQPQPLGECFEVIIYVLRLLRFFSHEGPRPGVASPSRCARSTRSSARGEERRSWDERAPLRLPLSPDAAVIRFNIIRIFVHPGWI